VDADDTDGATIDKVEARKRAELMAAQAAGKHKLVQMGSF
jgi:hypothetical protein